MNENQDYMEKTQYHPKANTYKNFFTQIAVVNMQHTISCTMDAERDMTNQKLMKAKLI